MTDKTTLQNDRGLLIAELEAAGAKFKGNSCNCPFHDDHHPMRVFTVKMVHGVSNAKSAALAAICLTSGQRLRGQARLRNLKLLAGILGRNQAAAKETNHPRRYILHLRRCG